MEKDEEQILLILATFEKELSERLQETKTELERVKYYEKLQIRGIDFEGIFVTQEKDVDGNIINNIYSKGPDEKIISIDSKGNITINPDLAESLREIGVKLEGLTLEEIEKENDKQPDRLKGISQKGEEKDQQLEEENDKEKDVTKQLEEDLIEEDQSLEISYYRKIDDKNLDSQIKQNFSGCEEVGIAYDKKTNAFILVEKQDGQFKMAEGFEKAKPTMRTVVSIDEKGEKVEKKVPHALMKTNNPDKEMSITIGQYGYIEAGTVDVLPCNTRVEMQLKESGEGEQGRTENTLIRAKREEGTEGMHNWVHEHEEEINKMDNGEKIEENVTEELKNNGEHIYTEDEEALI